MQKITFFGTGAPLNYMFLGHSAEKTIAKFFSIGSHSIIISEYPKISEIKDFIGTMRGGDSYINQCSIANTEPNYLVSYSS